LHIKSVKIENLRNITHAELVPHKGLNIIVGNNGAGKTSLLESIYLLARARSFRQKKSGKLINEKAEKLILFAQLLSEDNRVHSIGLEKTTTKTEIRKDGKNLKKLSELAKSIPLTIITPNLQRIIEEEPQNRRRLINWGLFHVEHDYAELANKYKKILMQRNKALRFSHEQIKVWDKQLIPIGNEIFRLMDQYTTSWNCLITELINITRIVKPLSFELIPGWKHDESFADSLERNLILDKERGYTSSGPHRADLRILHNGKLAKNIFSRGEAKLAAILMLLSQMKLLAISNCEKPILLADDLKSELDINSYTMIIDLIQSLDVQCFVTNLECHKTNSTLSDDSYRLFHVEHGEILTK
jgi:DNA replication and repair protein RecF